MSAMRTLALAMMLGLGAGCAHANPAPPQAAPALQGQITFLYYHDLPAAAAFYERLLGRSPEDTPDWVRLFPLTGGARLGLVNATGGALRPSDEKPVMVTLVVDGQAELDRWYERVQSLGIAIGREPRTMTLTERRSIRSFMFRDPEGYTIECLTFLETAAAN